MDGALVGAGSLWPSLGSHYDPKPYWLCNITTVRFCSSVPGECLTRHKKKVPNTHSF
jgi:hypothetical protein